jgi:hypothetical protein
MTTDVSPTALCTAARPASPVFAVDRLEHALPAFLFAPGRSRDYHATALEPYWPGDPSPTDAASGGLASPCVCGEHSAAHALQSP